MGSRRTVVIAVVLTVVLGAAVGAGSWWFMSRGTGESALAGGESSPAAAASRGKGRVARKSQGANVANFAGKPITRDEFEAAWKKQFADQPEAERKIPPQALLGQRFATLLDIVDQRVYAAAAAEYGIAIDDKIRDDNLRGAAQAEAFRRHGGEQELNYFLTARGITLDAYLTEIAKEVREKDPEGLDRRLLTVLVGDKVAEDVTVTEEDLPRYLRVAHVKRIAQLLDPTGKPEDRVTEGDAKAKIDEAYAKLSSGTKFEEVLQQYGNGPEKAQGGDIPPVPYGADAAFDEVVWGLKAGECSKPFQGERGWHIIKVVSFEQQPVAPDAQQKRAQIAQVEGQLKQAKVAKWLDDKQKEGGLEVLDSDLAGYQALSEGRLDDARTLLETALTDSDGSAKASIQSCLAKAYTRLGRTDDAEKLLVELVDKSAEEDRGAVLLDRADFYLSTDQEEKALTDIAEAARLAPTEGDRLQIAQLYVRINHPDKAKELVKTLIDTTTDPGVWVDVCQFASAMKWQDTLEASEAKLVAWIGTAPVDAAEMLQRLGQGAADAGWVTVARACATRLQAIESELRAAAAAESQPPQQQPSAPPEGQPR